jgi:hypothetical protein
MLDGLIDGLIHLGHALQIKRRQRAGRGRADPLCAARKYHHGYNHDEKTPCKPASSPIG